MRVMWWRCTHSHTHTHTHLLCVLYLSLCPPISLSFLSFSPPSSLIWVTRDADMPQVHWGTQSGTYIVSKMVSSPFFCISPSHNTHQLSFLNIMINGVGYSRFSHHGQIRSLPTYSSADVSYWVSKITTTCNFK